jgi:hypothetical protein
LTVLPSYQAENVGNFLRDYLIDKKIKVNLWNNAKNCILNINDYLEKDEPILFIFTGPDNYQNLQFFNFLKQENEHQIFAITTQSQNEKININYKYILKSNLSYMNAFVREVLMELIFLEIFE